ncbi:MAG TPA: response regulator [Flavitalea sp.]|nr:response regulator [Flavitalea sp.]
MGLLGPFMLCAADGSDSIIPWYRSWWAYLLYVTTGCSLIYLYTRYKSERYKQAYEVALARIETEKQMELNEKKLAFFSNVSHEFRAPLTLIIDPVKELLHNPDKRSGTVGLHVVYRNARRLLSLVDQLSLLRQAGNGLDDLKRVRVNFYELCYEVFICFSNQAISKDIIYEFSGSNPSLELMVEPEKMEIILFNLLSNALKFTSSGGKVTFRIKETTDTPGLVEVVISDTGCGVEASIGNKLFEKFYQVRNNQNATQNGFGIGLYLVSEFVHEHEGTIRYKSEKGSGTSFIMTLPRKEFCGQPAETNDWSPEQSAGRKPVFLEELLADLEADTDTGKHRGIQRTGTDDKRLPALPDIISEKKSILLVDDNTSVREYLNNIFTDRFLVFEAESGEDGLLMAVSQMPDIIISDVIMNGMTGVDFCRKIKADPELNHIPVILLTATTSFDIKLKGIECGAEDYITKPFEKELLIARVDNILKNRNTIQQYFLDMVTLRENKTKVSASYRDFLDRCIEVIEKEIDNENFTIKSFALKMGMSHSSLYKKVKCVSGLSLNAFIRFLRLRKAALLLLSTDTNINDAAFQVGFGDAKYFRSQFNKLFGMNPSEYIKRYKSNFDKDYNVVG